MVVSSDGVRNAWVTPAERIRSVSSAPAAASGPTIRMVDAAENAMSNSRTEASKLGDAMCIVRLSARSPNCDTCCAAKSASPRWLTTTPLGVPVVPEV